MKGQLCLPYASCPSPKEKAKKRHDGKDTLLMLIQECHLTMRLCDAGLRQHQTKALYPNHRPPPCPNEDATRDRSNRLLGACVFAKNCAAETLAGKYHSLSLPPF
jgi:hypothetical protein